MSSSNHRKISRKEAKKLMQQNENRRVQISPEEQMAQFKSMQAQTNAEIIANKMSYATSHASAAADMARELVVTKSMSPAEALDLSFKFIKDFMAKSEKELPELMRVAPEDPTLANRAREIQNAINIVSRSITHPEKVEAALDKAAEEPVCE